MKTGCAPPAADRRRAGAVDPLAAVGPTRPGPSTPGAPLAAAADGSMAAAVDDPVAAATAPVAAAAADDPAREAVARSVRQAQAAADSARDAGEAGDAGEAAGRDAVDTVRDAALDDDASVTDDARGPAPGTPPRRMTRRERLIAQWAQRLKPRFSDGNAVTLYERGAEFFPALEREISRARREIYMETYLFHDDPSGWRIARALAEAARRGVRTHLMVDGYGGAALSAGQAALMRDAGVRIEIFRPEGRRFALSRQRLRRLHRKITVVDARVAFVGGINVLDDLDDPNHGRLPAPRLDYSTRLEGPILAQIHWAVHRHYWSTALVNRALRRAGRAPDERFWERARLPEPAPAQARPAGDVRAMFVLRDNIRFRHTIERRYLWAIRRARREILIANAYFLPGVRFRRALIAAARRGVRVRLLLQGRVEYVLQHHASQALYDELLRAGIEIVEYHASFLHAKVAVIDDWCTVGSSNIDPFSLLLARESNVVFDDARVAAELRGRLERAMAEGGRPVALRHVERRAWPVRVVNWCSFVLLRIAVSLTGAAGRY